MGRIDGREGKQRLEPKGDIAAKQHGPVPVKILVAGGVDRMTTRTNAAAQILPSCGLAHTAGPHCRAQMLPYYVTVATPVAEVVLSKSSDAQFTSAHHHRTKSSPSRLSGDLAVIATAVPPGAPSDEITERRHD
ncbi:hypothetical protein SCUP234_11424 [Seiridium cupressi]